MQTSSFIHIHFCPTIYLSVDPSICEKLCLTFYCLMCSGMCIYVYICIIILILVLVFKGSNMQDFLQVTSGPFSVYLHFLSFFCIPIPKLPVLFLYFHVLFFSCIFTFCPFLYLYLLPHFCIFSYGSFPVSLLTALFLYLYVRFFSCIFTYCPFSVPLLPILFLYL